MTSLGENVDVIRHHAPGVKRIALAVKMEERRFDGIRGQAPKQAGAYSAIECFLSPAEASACFLRGARFVLAGIGEAEDDVLYYASAVKVRQIATMAPPGLDHGRDVAFAAAGRKGRLEAGATRTPTRSEPKPPIR